MFTTMRALYSVRFAFRPGAKSAAPPAKPGRNTCAQNSFNRAGIAPSHKGEKITRCSARPMIVCASRITAGGAP
jgi:hypothetical protein